MWLRNLYLLHCVVLLHTAFVPAARPSPRASRCTVVVKAEQQEQAELSSSRRGVLSAGAALVASSTLPLVGASPALANKVVSPEWEQVRANCLSSTGVARGKAAGRRGRTIG